MNCTRELEQTPRGMSCRQFMCTISLSASFSRRRLCYSIRRHGIVLLSFRGRMSSGLVKRCYTSGFSPTPDHSSRRCRNLRASSRCGNPRIGRYFGTQNTRWYQCTSRLGHNRACRYVDTLAFISTQRQARGLIHIEMLRKKSNVPS